MLEAGGHEVMPFADESDALARIKADASIEALITSAELKHMSGVELCWETRLLATSRRPPDGSLSAIILDIDNFKQINDSFSHETGDEAICVCARAAFLNGAVVGRLGGDEFALLLKDRTLPQAVEIAEGVRTRLFEQSFDTGRGRIRLICSLGVGEGAEPAIPSTRSSRAPMPRSTTPSSRGAIAWSASMRECRCATPSSPKESCAPARWPRRLSSFSPLPSYPRAAAA